MSGPTTVYLDHNATTPLCPAARAAMAEALAVTGNPSSVHGPGRRARAVVEGARRAIAAAVAVSRADRVTLTSGATEANAMVLGDAVRRGVRLLVAAVEHDSVLANAPGAAVIPVDGLGVVDLAALEALLGGVRDRETLVVVQAVNNELGTIQPVAEIARLAAAQGARVHCDAAQALGKIAIDAVAWGAATLTLSAHKAGGPAGIGALIHLAGPEPAPLLLGGGQERGRRAGTHNLVGVAGFGAAAAEAPARLAAMGQTATLRDRLEAAITVGPAAAMIHGAVIHGAGADRVANTSCIGLGGVAAETQVMRLDLAGYAVSAGSACSSGKVRASHVLRAIGLDEVAAGSAIRVSLGPETTAAEIDGFVAAWTAMACDLAGLRPRAPRGAPDGP